MNMLIGRLYVASFFCCCFVLRLVYILPLTPFCFFIFFFEINVVTMPICIAPIINNSSLIFASHKSLKESFTLILRVMGFVVYAFAHNIIFFYLSNSKLQLLITQSTMPLIKAQQFLQVTFNYCWLHSSSLHISIDSPLDLLT